MAALMAWGQYVPNDAEQALKAMAATKYAIIAFPFIGTLLINVMLALFDLEKKLPQIKKDLADRAAAKATN